MELSYLLWEACFYLCITYGVTLSVTCSSNSTNQD